LAILATRLAIGALCARPSMGQNRTLPTHSKDDAMNLWFRLIWMLLTVRWRAKAGVMDATRLRMTVLPNDLDFNGHVNNGRYLTLADVARMDFVLRTGTARVALAMRARPIVGDAMAKFRRDLRPFQRYDIETRMLGWNEKWSFMEHRFVRDGRVLGVVVMRGLFVAPGGPVTPAQLADALRIDPVSPPLPAWVLAWHQSCEQLSDAVRAEEAETGIVHLVRPGSAAAR
jgi:acyl-CoA thioesterase FadM